MTTAFLKVGEQKEFRPPARFKGYDRKTPMPPHYNEAAVVFSKDFTEYADRTVALAECEGPVYEVEAVYRVRRLK